MLTSHELHSSFGGIQTNRGLSRFLNHEIRPSNLCVIFFFRQEVLYNTQLIAVKQPVESRNQKSPGSKRSGDGEGNYGRSDSTDHTGAVTPNHANDDLVATPQLLDDAHIIVQRLNRLAVYFSNNVVSSQS